MLGREQKNADPEGEGYESVVEERYLIHYTLFVSTAGAMRVLNIVLAVGPTSPTHT